MSLTQRKDSYYVEFRVVDRGKTLELAKGGGKLKRWKVGCLNKAEAKTQEAIIKTRLLAGTMPSDGATDLVMTFETWAKDYVQIEEVKKLRSYRERCQRIERLLVPFFGKKLLSDITAKDVERFRTTRNVGHALATVNVDRILLNMQ